MKRTVGTAAILLAVVAVGLGIPAWFYFMGYNFRIVENGGFYASRQMPGSALETRIRKYGIKTVINLRGDNTGQPWYDDEIATCKRLGITHVDFRWSRNNLPDPDSLEHYVELIEKGQRPFLAHCEGGTHRTGVAAACYLLVEGKGPRIARRQFGPMFDDAPIGKVVDLYEKSGIPFTDWVRDVYPVAYKQLHAGASATSAASPSKPATTPAG
jgi:protein tyrosine phosphatase (PTP) superfamily phosphohydrolase (DUF442 family)